MRLLGSLFQEHGFATAAVANNPFLHPGFGLARGFDAELEGQLRALGYLE